MNEETLEMLQTGPWRTPSAQHANPKFRPYFPFKEKPKKIQYRRRQHWLHLQPEGSEMLRFVSFFFPPEKTSDLSDVHFKSINPPQHPSVCANWSSAPTCSVHGETVIKPPSTTLHRAVSFVQWSCDPGVSHLLKSGPAVTCSWPRCWSPGRRPWSDWCDTNRRLRQLRRGSETPSPPAPTWEHKHRYRHQN